MKKNKTFKFFQPRINANERYYFSFALIRGCRLFDPLGSKNPESLAEIPLENGSRILYYHARCFGKKLPDRLSKARRLRKGYSTNREPGKRWS